MFTCKFCSLQFNTKPELNVHIEKCRENIQSPLKASSSKLHICEFCDKSFMTAGELDAHTCPPSLGPLFSMLQKLKKHLESVTQRAKPRALGQCHYCLQILYTVDEAIGHRKTCEGLPAAKEIESEYRLYKETIGKLKRKPITLNRMALPSLKPLTSEENEQSKSSKKRVLDTSTEGDNASKSESSLETSSPPSKICRSSDKDIIDIETGQESANDSKICDAKTKICAKKTFDCVFCALKFQSLDALQTHIIPCCKKFKK